jgi:hypothetical protein
LKADSQALENEQKTVEQERERLSKWEEALNQQSIWLETAQQNLIDTQAQLEGDLLKVKEGLSLVESLETMFRNKLSVLDKDLQEIRQAKERLVWLQVGTLLTGDLILIVEIAWSRRHRNRRWRI